MFSVTSTVGTGGSVVSVLDLDSLFESSFAVALTVSAFFILAYAIVILPVLESILMPSAAPSVIVQPSSPFVAITVFSVPSAPGYLTVTVFVSASLGGVI